MGVARIYALTDLEGNVRYVGQTFQSLIARFKGHLRRAESGHVLHVYNWWRSLPQPPGIILLERCSQEAANDRERFWVAHFRKCGCDLTNATDGGTFGRVDDATRVKISQAYRAHLADPANYAAFLRRVRDPERCRKVSESNKGKKMSADDVARLKEGQARAAATTSWSHSVAGRSVSEEGRARTAAANRARWASYTPEQRQARGDAIRAGRTRARLARGGDAQP